MAVVGIIPGDTPTSLGKNEDAAHASGDTGVMLLAVRKDSAAALAGTDGDYIPLTTDSTGRLRIAALPASSGVDIGDVDVASIAAGTNTIGATRDAGPAQTVTRTYTANADFSTARDVTAAPTAGQKIVALDIVVSMATACLVTVEMETSHNVLAGAYLPANGTMVFTLRGLLKADAADKKLQVKSSVASAGVVTAVYFSEA